MFELASHARTLPNRFWPAANLVVAGGLYLATMISWWHASGGYPGLANSLLAAVLAATAGAAFRWPLAALGVALAACTVATVARHRIWPADLAVLVALFYVGRRRPTWEAFCITLGSTVYGVLVSLRYPPMPAVVVPIWAWVSWLLTAGAVGSVAQSHHLFLVSRAARWDTERAEQRRAGRQMITEERLRIARELHDTVGHSLTMISVQSGVAAHVIDTDPAAVRFALEHIHEASSAALDEIRTTLGLLRGDEPAEPATGPDESLPSLVDRTRSGGLPVELEITGDPSELPAVVNRTLYRLTQESLTNAVRHARHLTRVVVHLAFSSGRVRLEITNDGDPVDPASVREGAAAGHGIAGMRERLSALGGSLTAVPLHEGGFRVTATMPTGARP
ncbi:sensor histidine kinase [Actinoplanes sp. NPDC049118]|uniref:sensor histidine kinase n=1 Tax=Actinoplanes sp. NPDC049118 TaxID=3155769 RepID=UPI0033CEE69D